VPAGTKRRRQSRLMRAQKHLVTRAHAARIGHRVRLLVDGPSDEHELVLRARLEGQAPDIDPVVYLTECSPADITTGTFVDADVVGRHDYDLIARPVADASAARQSATARRQEDCL